MVRRPGAVASAKLETVARTCMLCLMTVSSLGRRVSCQPIESDELRLWSGSDASTRRALQSTTALRSQARLTRLCCVKSGSTFHAPRPTCCCSVSPWCRRCAHVAFIDWPSAYWSIFPFAHVPTVVLGAYSVHVGSTSSCVIVRAGHERPSHAVFHHLLV